MNKKFFNFRSRLSYKISYDLNGGTGLIENTVFRQKVVCITSVIPKREGYDFLGWSTDKTANVPEYLPDEVYRGKNNITLYAVWSLTPIIKSNLKKCDNYYVCSLQFENVTSHCKIFFAVYSKMDIVQFKISSYSASTQTYEIFNDFDSIRIIVSDNTNKVTPITAMKTIYK